MQFMNSSVEQIVKNLSDNDFKYLTKEFDSLELLRQKGAYPYEYMDSFEIFNEEKKNSLIKNVFADLQKMEQLVIMVKN